MYIDTKLTDLQRRHGNCPGRKGVSKCMDGSEGGDGDVHKLSAFNQRHCQQKAEGWKQHGSTVPNKHYLLQQVHGWGGSWRSAPWVLSLQIKEQKILQIYIFLSF